MLAATLFAHDLAAFRVHAAAGLGGDGCLLALLQRPALWVMLTGPGRAVPGVRLGAGAGQGWGSWFSVPARARGIHEAMVRAGLVSHPPSQCRVRRSPAPSARP